jgi:hypothetical protein
MLFPPVESELKKNPTAFWIGVIGNASLIALAWWAFIRNGL